MLMCQSAFYYCDKTPEIEEKGFCFVFLEVSACVHLAL